jgi:hypothetical protein
MNRLAQMDSEDIKKLIYDRVHSHSEFKTVIAVSVDRYASEYSAIVWVGQEPNSDMRKYAYSVEAELARHGVACSILVKSDKELAVGGVYQLQTRSGQLSYRYYKLDTLKDEDAVFGFAVYRGDEVYRFRVSLTGTLASMLRQRGQFDEDRLLEVYKDWIRTELDQERAARDRLNEKMFNSKEISLFTHR